MIHRVMVSDHDIQCLYLVSWIDNIYVWYPWYIQLIHNNCSWYSWYTIFMSHIQGTQYLYIWYLWYIMLTSGIHDTQFNDAQHLCPWYPYKLKYICLVSMHDARCSCLVSPIHCFCPVSWYTLFMHVSRSDLMYCISHPIIFSLV